MDSKRQRILDSKQLAGFEKAGCLVQLRLFVNWSIEGQVIISEHDAHFSCYESPEITRGWFGTYYVLGRVFSNVGDARKYAKNINFMRANYDNFQRIWREYHAYTIADCIHALGVPHWSKERFEERKKAFEAEGFTVYEN